MSSKDLSGVSRHLVMLKGFYQQTKMDDVLKGLGIIIPANSHGLK